MDTSLIEKTILELADSMASAASSFSSHGYDSFIQARDIFQSTLHSILEKVKQ